MNLFPQAKRTGRILVLGELLLDFIPTQSGMRLCEPGTVVKTVSGSAGIFACAAAALGAQCGFVGRVGKDPFSRLAVQTVAQAGVDTSLVVESEEGQIGLAFIEYLPEGRNYQYYRSQSAGSRLCAGDLDEKAIAQAQILHLPGMLLELNETMREACFAAVEMARRHDVLISFDPNIRKELSGDSGAIERLRRMTSYADIIKPTLEEARLLTGEHEIPAILQRLHGMGPRLVAVSRDKQGALLSAGGEEAAAPGIDVPVVDPTGAGDSFAAALCRCVQRNSTLEEAARFCNCVGTLVCTRRGAIGMAIPSLAEAEALMRSPLCTVAGR
ncbi:MAG: sugar kinase [Oscillospiraceae bacterium]|nr:sugar kinase [Oscillospiraceae bacterium]